MKSLMASKRGDGRGSGKGTTLKKGFLHGMTPISVLIRIVEIAVVGLCVMLYGNQQEQRADITAVKATVATQGNQITKLETKSAVIEEGVKEMRQDLKVITIVVQDVRVYMQAAQQAANARAGAIR